HLELVRLLYLLNIIILMKSFTPTQLLSLHGKGQEEGRNTGAHTEVRMWCVTAPLTQKPEIPAEVYKWMCCNMSCLCLVYLNFISLQLYDLAYFYLNLFLVVEFIADVVIDLSTLHASSSWGDDG
ncbi:hypothetical protein INR49_013674, partial [Caranx melampygus]